MRGGATAYLRSAPPWVILCYPLSSIFAFLLRVLRVSVVKFLRLYLPPVP
jgi:hypothetical protein